MDISAAVTEIDAQGFTVVRDLITGTRLEQLQRDAEQLLHPIEAKCVDGGTVAGRMHKGTFGASRAFDDIIVHPTILAIVGGVLDEARSGDYPHADELAAYIAGLDTAERGIKCNIMIKDAAPREDIRALHRDIRLPVPRPHPPVICNCLLALDPFTEETGATCVVPGSHKWDDRPIDADAKTVPVLMDPGAIVIFDGALWHGHGPNYAYDRYRRCLNLNYHYRWIRNFPTPPLPAAERDRLPAELRALV